VRAEQNAILIVEKKLAGAPWLPAQFGLAGAKFHIHVGILIEPGGDRVEIFRPIGDVQRNECRVRVLGDDAVALLEQRLLGRKLRTKKNSTRDCASTLHSARCAGPPAGKRLRGRWCGWRRGCRACRTLPTSGRVVGRRWPPACLIGL